MNWQEWTKRYLPGWQKREVIIVGVVGVLAVLALLVVGDVRSRFDSDTRHAAVRVPATHASPPTTVYRPQVTTSVPAVSVPPVTAPVVTSPPAPAPAPSQSTCNASDPSLPVGQQCVQAFYEAWKANNVQAAQSLASTLCNGCDDLFDGRIPWKDGWSLESCQSPSNEASASCTYKRADNPYSLALSREESGSYILTIKAKYNDISRKWQVVEAP
jgi:hypothetical protein